jgi:hypothetical protein
MRAASRRAAANVSVNVDRFDGGAHREHCNKRVLVHSADQINVCRMKTPTALRQSKTMRARSR